MFLKLWNIWHLPFIIQNEQTGLASTYERTTTIKCCWNQTKFLIGTLGNSTWNNRKKNSKSFIFYEITLSLYSTSYQLQNRIKNSNSNVVSFSFTKTSNNSRLWIKFKWNQSKYYKNYQCPLPVNWYPCFPLDNIDLLTNVLENQLFKVLKVTTYSYLPNLIESHWRILILE